MSEIKLEFEGKANVHWSETETDENGEEQTRHFASEEKYFKHKIKIWKRGYTLALYVRA